jgi:chromosome segregation ATPase
MKAERDVLYRGTSEHMRALQTEQKAAAKLQKQIDKQAEALKSQAAEIDDLRARRKESTARVASLEADLDTYATEMVTLRAESEQMTARIEAIEAERQQDAARMAALREERDVSRSETQAARDERDALAAARLAEQETLRDQLRDLAEKSASEASAAAGRETQQQQRLAELEKERDDLKAEQEQACRQFDQARADWEARMTALNTQHDAVRKRAAALTKALSDAKARHAALKEAADRQEQALEQRLRVLRDDAIGTTSMIEQAQAEMVKHQKRSTELENAQRLDAERIRGLEERIQELKTELDARPEAPKPEKPWHLKLDDGNVYGPVPLADLEVWAADCRIGPDHEVSTDREHWLRAGDVPQLHMDWTVTLVDGSAYGPLHLQAVRHLVADGSVASDSTIRNGRTGEVCPLSQVLTDEVMALAEANRRLTRELAERDARLAKLERRVREFEAPPRPEASVAPPKSVIAQVQRARLAP